MSPQASCIASFMQQRLPRLSVSEIVEINAKLKELRDYQPQITFLAPGAQIVPKVSSFSDASFNISTAQRYGQSGTVTGIMFDATEWRKRILHPEILACTDADDRGYNTKTALQAILRSSAIQHELNVDFKGLYDTITTMHEGRDFKLRQTFQRIRDSFE